MGLAIISIIIAFGQRMKPVIKSLIASTILTLTAASTFATAKPEPSGIYALVFGVNGKPTDLTDNPLLDNPNVDGFRYKMAWKAIQPTSASEYKWDQMDSQIAIAAAAGKKMGISIAAGIATPDWVYTDAPAVYRYHMLEIDPETGESIGDQPLPWDTAYQAKWLQFVAALGARYDGNPAFSYVVLGGFMQSSPMYFVKTLDDDAAVNALAQNPPNGYPGLTTSYTDSSAAYNPAAEAIIAAFMDAFPTTPVILTLANPFPTDQGVEDQKIIKNWALAQYPVRFGTMVSALYASPPPHDPPDPPLPYPKGFQMVCRASDAARLYLDPDPVPLPPAPIPLQDALERGVTLGGKYVEVYDDDLYPEISQPVIATERVKLKANVYGTPAAPINLRVVK